MIPRDHRHTFRPVNVFDRPDGTREYHLICQNITTGTRTDQQGAIVDVVPGCGIEQALAFQKDDAGQWRCVGVRFRVGGLWLAALDLVRLLPVPVEECPDCHGDPVVYGLCPRCVGSGVVQPGGAPIEPPAIR